MVDLAIVIVTWNVCDLALQALNSLFADLNNSHLNARVVVVDSASADNTVTKIREHFPQVELIASAENLGFAKANNVGLTHLGFGTAQLEALPPIVYLLNPDTITQLGATQAMLDVLKAQASVGVVGANLTYGDNSFQAGAFMFPGLRQLWVEFFPTPGRAIEGSFNGRYPRALYHGTQPFEVDFTLGATMMMRREVIVQTGMFDEAYFMYCEEIDWAWRIRKAGWQIQCVPTAHVVHLGGQSTGQIRATSVVNLWQSRFILFRKHYPRWKWAIARWMIALGMLRKMRQLDPKNADSSAIRQAYQTIFDKALHP